MLVTSGSFENRSKGLGLAVDSDVSLRRSEALSASFNFAFGARDSWGAGVGP